MYQDEIDKLNLSIDDLEKDKLAQERDISVLKDKEKYQTDQQKRKLHKYYLLRKHQLKT